MNRQELRAALLGAPKQHKTKTVQLDTGDRTLHVTIRSLTKGEYDDIQNRCADYSDGVVKVNTGLYQMLAMIACARDEEGEPLFAETDIDALREFSSSSWISELQEAVNELNDMGGEPDVPGDQEGNSSDG